MFRPAQLKYLRGRLVGLVPWDIIQMPGLDNTFSPDIWKSFK